MLNLPFMISHQHKCIFIHIQRCAGTSIETWLTGSNWWLHEARTKHLIASQARKIYASYWDEYFKFSIVRNPFSRVPSMMRHNRHFGIKKKIVGSLDFSGYEALYGSDIIIEYDHRFYRREEVATAAHRPGTIYGNILDEELDYIARYESLAADMALVRDRLRHPKPFGCIHLERSKLFAKRRLTARDHSWIKRAYSADLEVFGYGSQ